jgi:hypothetical protein
MILIKNKLQPLQDARHQQQVVALFAEHAQYCSSFFNAFQISIISTHFCLRVSGVFWRRKL